MRVWLDPRAAQGARPDDAGRGRRASASRTCRSRPGRSASRPRPTRPGVPVHRHRRSAGSSDAEQFEDIVVKAEGTARDRVPAATWPASSSARRPTTRSPRATASPPPSIGIFQLPGRQRARAWPKACARRWSGSSRRFPRGWSTRIPFDTTMFVDACDRRGLQDADRSRRAGADRHPACSCRTGGRCSCRRRPCR